MGGSLWWARRNRRQSTATATRTDTAMHIDELFQFHFMTNALEAGTLVAVLASAIGWFMVVRQQTFAGHTLSLIAFPGAAAAALAGAPVFVGYFAACAAGARALAAVSG